MCIVLSCSYFQLAKNTAKSIIPAALRLRAPQKNFRFAKVGLGEYVLARGFGNRLTHDGLDLFFGCVVRVDNAAKREYQRSGSKFEHMPAHSPSWTGRFACEPKAKPTGQEGASGQVWLFPSLPIFERAPCAGTSSQKQCVA